MERVRGGGLVLNGHRGSHRRATTPPALFVALNGRRLARVALLALQCVMPCFARFSESYPTPCAWCLGITEHVL